MIIAAVLLGTIFAVNVLIEGMTEIFTRPGS